MKYVVPDGMITAAQNAIDYDRHRGDVNLRACLEAAVQWWSENPIGPTDDQMNEIMADSPVIVRVIQDQAEDSSIEEAVEAYRTLFAVCLIQMNRLWQQRMFLAPGPDIRDQVRDLLSEEFAVSKNYHNEQILEAYRRGISRRDKTR